MEWAILFTKGFAEIFVLHRQQAVDLGKMSKKEKIDEVQTYSNLNKEKTKKQTNKYCNMYKTSQEYIEL